MANKKPWGITVTCMVFAVMAVVTLYTGMTMDTAEAPAEGVEEASVDIMSYLPMNDVVEGAMSGTSIGLIALGAVLAILTWFLWKEHDVAWYFAVGLLGIGVVVDVAMIMFYGAELTNIGIFTLGLSVFLVLALFHKDTMSAVKPEMIDYAGWDLSSVS